MDRRKLLSKLGVGIGAGIGAGVSGVIPGPPGDLKDFVVTESLAPNDRLLIDGDTLKLQTRSADRPSRLVGRRR